MLAMSACAELMEFASAGVAPALRAVDCMAGEMTASAFGRLFGPQGALLPVLTICLTLYIAFFAFMLLTGRASLGVSSLVPRMFTIGLVLTFATSWIAYSQLLWNLAVAGPDWIAGVLTGAGGGRASTIFADRIDIVFGAIGQAGELARAAGGEGAPGAGAGMFQPADIMWLGALLLLLGTVGLLLTARIALAVLMALGPVFVVLGLFSSTRGLTAGWLKGVVLTALVPLFVVLGGSITLEMLVPVISALSQGAALGEITPRAAIALFLLAAVHTALMTMIARISSTIVANWNIFGMTSRTTADQPLVQPVQTAQAATPQGAAAAAQEAGTAAWSRARQSALAASSLAADGANTSPPAPHHRSREVIVATSPDHRAAAAPHALRSRGIGSRFRPQPGHYREKRA